MTEKLDYECSLALVGAGYWGKNLARNFYQLGSLHTVCDSNKEITDQLVQDYKGLNIEHDYQKVLDNPDLNKVAIAAPAKDHYLLTKKALEANKDVFVEKPLCLDIEECNELVALAKTRDRVLMVGHLLQYHPCIEKIHEILANGDLGKLYYITSNRLNLGKIRKEENALWSFAPHDISVILSLVSNSLPEKIQCVGGAYLDNNVADTTMTTMSFNGGVRAHIYVSWLNPFKEQKLTIVGSDGMIVFDDTKEWKEKLTLYNNHLYWGEGQIPTPNKASGEYVEVEKSEPLKNECIHFLDCCDKELNPRTNGEEGLRVLTALSLAQKSLNSDGVSVTPNYTKGNSLLRDIHPTAVIDNGASIGKGTKIWHFAHICSGSKIGENCVFGQNTMVADGVIVGDNVKVQNNVAIYNGVTIENDVFLGPSCVLTNVSNPRSQINRKDIYEKTLIRLGATVGANATIIPGVTLGRYSFVSAGAIVTRDVKDYAFMKGAPARQVGWISRHGHALKEKNGSSKLVCPESGYRYVEANGELRCLDLDENMSIPEGENVGSLSYRSFKSENKT